VVVLQGQVGDVHLDFVFALGLLGVPFEFLFNLEEASFDFSFNVGGELLLSVLDLDVLVLELLEGFVVGAGLGGFGWGRLVVFVDWLRFWSDFYLLSRFGLLLVVRGCLRVWYRLLGLGVEVIVCGRDYWDLGQWVHVRMCAVWYLRLPEFTTFLSLYMLITLKIGQHLLMLKTFLCECNLMTWEALIPIFTRRSEPLVNILLVLLVEGSQR